MSRLVSAEELLVLLNSNATLIFIAKIYNTNLQSAEQSMSVTRLNPFVGCLAGGIIVIEVCSKVYCTSLFDMWKTSSAYSLDGFYMIWKTGANNFGTDYNSHILHCEFKLAVGDRNCQVAPSRSTEGPNSWRLKLLFVFD